MGKNTEILWTDSTFNPWTGCRKIAPGCDNCYAERDDHRFGDHWSPGSEYKQRVPSYWHQPTVWNKNALKLGKRQKVFCGSMCDWADSNAPQEIRDDLWDLIRATPMLDWQLLTKRAKNIEKYLPQDWGSGYDNVWLGVTVEDKKHGLPRIDILREISAKIRFLSVEPLLEDLGFIDLEGIGWVIVGGESGPGARPMKKIWVEYIQIQCGLIDLPFFFKQWGRNDNIGANPDEKKGGNLLNGKTYLEFPRETKC